ncbi:MAG: hypothetical protein V3U65_17180 [Granulosicoccaceae bacterium]
MILLCQLPLLAISGELSQTEHAIAASLADATPWPPTLRSSLAAKVVTQVATKGSAHPLGLQTLSIEADWKKHADATRLARIYQYDHTQLKSRLLVVDVNSKQVIREQLINSVHLPLSTDEILYATAQLNASASLLLDINQERTQQLLTPITDLSSFDVKASIYEPTLTHHPCSTQRCVLFALVDATLTVSSVEPLVLLSSGDVQRLQDTLR